MSIYLSIIIPAYNEEDKIADTLNIVLKYIHTKQWQAEIIVVEDGSKDKTAQIVREFCQRYSCVHLLQNPGNRGKGYAVKEGALAAKGEYVLFTDADNSTPIEEVEKLLSVLEKQKCDIAIGSRALPKSQIEIPQPIYRKMMGKIFNIFFRIILGINVRDSQCGFKCFPQAIGKKLFPYQKLERFSFDAELLYIAKKKKYRVKEVPIVWRNRLESRVNPIKDSIRMFMDLCTIRKYDSSGCYKE
ncbi:MAG: glycosyltransferase family 2 protein [Candidatus Brocadiae bacterium]|nr:glycosyltransferase family 2 protein [Candidatus Brocadiia bacterium]